jgi:hypothetical protein
MASATVTIVPPFIVAIVPGNFAYPVFFFFAAYLALTSKINIWLVD